MRVREGNKYAGPGHGRETRKETRSLLFNLPRSEWRIPTAARSEAISRLTQAAAGRRKVKTCYGSGECSSGLVVRPPCGRCVHHHLYVIG